MPELNTCIRVNEMIKLLKYIKKYRKQAIIGPCFVVLSSLLELLQPILMSKIVDEGVVSGDLALITGLGCLMVLLAAAAMFAGYMNIKNSSTAGQGFGAELRMALFQKVQSFSFANIDEFSTASLVTRLTNDVNTVQMTLQMMLRILFRAPSMFIISGILAVSINKELAAVILVALPVLFIAAGAIMKRGTPLFMKMQKKLDSLNSAIQENLIGIRVVKSFVREDHERKKFMKSNEEMMQTALSAMYVMMLIMPAMMLIMNLSTLSVLWFGGRQVAAGAMGTGELMSFITYIMHILLSVVFMSVALVMLSRARASSARIAEVLETETDIESPKQPRAFKVERGGVELKNVSFKYKAGSGGYVLKDINLSIRPGERIAIMGVTGSSKTTLVQLIPRLYDATEGSVLVDGVDVKDYELDALRDGVGMVLQKNTLFSGTIRENIKWGDESASDERIKEAAKAAQAHDFIESFASGYDTVLGQSGVNLSGGQKQRLCIARALLKNPKILILDDSTSAVDTATEALLNESLSRSGMTQIIIAQRISSVKEADRIVLLDDGRIAGEGTHETLLKTSEIYRDIVWSQESEVSA
ncbi:MAG: putative ABC transporter ATP-binding protein [Firmicutes bacterium ADurb.Bin182]|nr:MAG: putative ABC transporter ATP-binding protein [Firmicutes bacterium ADurb.Bin182]